MLLVSSLLTAVCGGRGALGERRKRLFPGNPVLLDLQVLPLVLLVGLLLVLCDQVVDVGSALASRDVPWRTGVEDPVNIMLALVLLKLFHSLAHRLRVALFFRLSPVGTLLLFSFFSSPSSLHV